MRILLLADIHIGSIKDIIYVYNVITDIIEKELIFTKTDLIVILGDYFDKLFKTNEIFTNLAINVMSYLIRACIKNNTKIRIIYGTESHEMNQYGLFNFHLTSDDVDIKIFDTITEEETLPGTKILYIPEEHIYDKYEYYSKYLYNDKHYNYIFGHGIVEDGLPKNMALNISISKSNEKQVPRFKSGEFSSISDITVFGHYHCYTNISDNVYYLGSLFRDSFGEEIPKGYGVIEDNKFNFIENKEAYVYNTYYFDESSEIYKSPNNIVKEIKKIKEKNTDIFENKKKGKIRLSFKLPDDISETFKETLRSILFNEKLISIDITEKNIDDTVTDDEEDELEFVLDNSLSIIDKIFQYIGKGNYQMSLGALTSYINDPLKIT